MKHQWVVLFLAGVVLLTGCGEQNEKPQYEAGEPVIVANA